MRNADLLKAALVCFVLSTLGAMVTSAQTFQTAVQFDGTNGSYPVGIFLQATDRNMYGGTNGVGGDSTVFQLTPSDGFTTLSTFCLGCGYDPVGLIQGSDGNLYGVNFNGGAYGEGTVFQLTLSGTQTVLYDFCPLTNCPDGRNPVALVQGSDGNFYGLTNQGGVNDTGGTAFQLTSSGAFTVLHNFCSTGCLDGEFPNSLVRGRDGNFYGLTGGGGSNNAGTAFRVTPSGTLTTLADFCSGGARCVGGGGPDTILQGRDGNFYGATSYGGNGGGAIFKMTPSGTLTTLYDFCSLANCADGSDPNSLIQGSDGNFYGTTLFGGVNRKASCSKTGCGTFFRLTPGGVLTTLHNFCSGFSCADGVVPSGMIQINDGTFYGAAAGIGNRCPGTDCGSIWSLALNVALAPTFTPASLNFGNQAIDTTSMIRSVTLKNVNTGFATFDFSNFTVNSPFAISSNTCGATLAAGKTCAVKVTFTPTVSGVASGTLSVTDNAPGSPQTVPLSGTGVAQTTLTPTSLAFGDVKIGTTSAAKKVTLKNNLPTTLTGISYSTAAPFAVSTSTCGTTLASKTSCTISVTFSPTTIGPASGTLNVTDSANNSPQTVSLSGTGD